MHNKSKIRELPQELIQFSLNHTVSHVSVQSQPGRINRIIISVNLKLQVEVKLLFIYDDEFMCIY